MRRLSRRVRLMWLNEDMAVWCGYIKTWPLVMAVKTWLLEVAIKIRPVEAAIKTRLFEAAIKTRPFDVAICSCGR